MHAVIASYTNACALQLRKKRGKTSVRVVGKCSDIPMAAVQYSTVSTVHYSTIQYSTVQHSTVQYSTLHYSTVQYSTVQ
jgi:hypothetical protein